MSDVPEKTEQEMKEAIGPEVTVPGPYPSGQVTSQEEADKSSEPTKQTREAGSLGDLTREVSTSTVAEESGGMGSPIYGDETGEDS